MAVQRAAARRSSRPWRPTPLTVLVLVAAAHVGWAAGPTDQTAHQRGLTETKLKANLLVQEGQNYYRGVANRHFTGAVLGYVTPWNSHGYTVAVRWRAKFTHISPVWYQLVGTKADGSFELRGRHDVDAGWIAQLREPVDADADCADGDGASQTCAAHLGTSAAPPLIVPRVLLELSTAQQLTALLSDPGPAVQLLVDEAQQQGFDGLVLEAWLGWASMGLSQNEAFKDAAVAFVRLLATRLHAAGKVLVLAVPPVKPSREGRPGAEAAHLQELAAVVDGYSLMTYDYSSTGAGPNGPLPWQQDNVDRLLAAPAGGGGGRTAVSPGKVLLGLNFYGYDFSRPDSVEPPRDAGGGDAKARRKAAQATDAGAPPQAAAIMGEAFLGVLRRVKPKLVWEAAAAEHRIKYKEDGLRHTVYYPTPASLAARLELAQRLGCGLSIWELGQGLDAFLDLL